MRRRVSLLVGGMVALIVGAALLAGSDEERPPIRVAADEPASTAMLVEPSSTTAMEPAPPPTTTVVATATPTAAPTTTQPSVRRRAIVTPESRAWALTAVDDGPHRCVELTAGAETVRVLCDKDRVDSGVVGDVASFPISGGWGVVALVEPSVDDIGLTGLVPTLPSGAAGADPDRNGYHYVANVLPGAGAPALNFFVFDGPHILARIGMPREARTMSRSTLDVSTGLPYGRWPGYRHGGDAGLWWGFQLVGFYDGPDGTPCVLFRRLDGSGRVLFDGCPARTGSPIALATLAPDWPGGQEARQPVLVVDGPASGWECVGEPTCQASPGRFIADPQGSDRRVGVLFAAAWPVGPASEREIVVLDGDVEVGRATFR